MRSKRTSCSSSTSLSPAASDSEHFPAPPHTTGAVGDGERSGGGGEVGGGDGGGKVAGQVPEPQLEP
eukprot:scaffold2455_cov54-Phaeocystis_antarctica.AAC.2